VSGSDGNALVIRGLNVAYRERPVLQDLDLTVHDGEFVVLMGPNGSGKSTLLRAIVGLEPVVSGSVQVAGREVVRLPTHRRGIVLMGQEPGLFAQRSVFENIAYPLMLHGVSDEETHREVSHLAERLQIQDHLDRDVAQISGGERQRVALARALAARPRVLLLDEPFNALDVTIRSELMADFRSVLSRAGIATLHVTHDRSEGLFLGERVALLFEGRLRAVGTPREIHDRPTDPTAARFLGYNLLTQGDSQIAVHPTEVQWSEHPEGGTPATVVASGSVGAMSRVIAVLPSGERLEIELAPGVRPPPPGARGGVSWSRWISLAPERPTSSGR
jgi:ABC-type sugar transport system ATPase subunit